MEEHIMDENNPTEKETLSVPSTSPAPEPAEQTITEPTVSPEQPTTESVQPHEQPVPSETTSTPTAAEPSQQDKPTKAKNKLTPLFITLLVVAVLGASAFGIAKCLIGNGGEENDNEGDNTNSNSSSYKIQDLDLAFLKIQNDPKNKVYSPLSIKSALGMIEEAAEGDSKTQISNVIGSYTPVKYPNSKNISFANAMFIDQSFKTYIKDSYTDKLQNKFGAEIFYDSNPKVLNNWVSDKTFGLIKDILPNDAEDLDFALANALAIDMEWVNKIQSNDIPFSVHFPHLDYFSKSISLIDEDKGYHELPFDNGSQKAKSVEIGAVINNYDIISTLGEEQIRKMVTEEYEKWLAADEYDSCPIEDKDFDTESVMDEYMSELSDNYGKYASSTDFYFYQDDNLNVFAKDLKEYDGITLQYVGIMPKNEDLADYIKNLNTSDISQVISSLKSVEPKSFKDGVITELNAFIPVFKIDHKIDLTKTLPSIGITDIFNEKTANLSNMTTKTGTDINFAQHKANIDFSNDGIKAAAVTVAGGFGAGGCKFDYDFDVPVEKIDLTFDKPYLFLIADKESGEVWFVGTVYQPTEFK